MHVFLGGCGGYVHVYIQINIANLIISKTLFSTGSQGAAISLVPGNAGLKLLKRIQTVCNTNLEPLPGE